MNYLKLNADKTEFMLIGSKKQLDKIQVDHITVGCSNITPVKRARNLGFTIDSTMSLHQHISQVVQSTSNNLRNLSKIRKYFSQQATKQLVHAFITSRLDMCNSLLYGIHKKTTRPSSVKTKHSSTPNYMFSTFFTCYFNFMQSSLASN